MAVLFDDSQLPPTALLAMSDLVALKAMAWLTARRWRVPQDVSVVGFDGVPEAALQTHCRAGDGGHPARARVSWMLRRSFRSSGWA